MANRNKRNRGSGNKDAVSDINITPLVDILLVLLIIFMVTAPMIHHGAKLNTPDASPSQAQSSPKDEKKATLEIDPKGKIKLRGQTVTIQTLFQSVKADKQLQEEKELLIQADPNLPYGTVMRAIGIVRKAGVVKLGVVVQNDALIE